MDDQSWTDNAIHEWKNKAWDKARGIENTDCNNHVVLLRASVEEVSRAVCRRYPQAKWWRDVLGANVVLGQEGLFIFRLSGHSWTELIHQHDCSYNFVLAQDYIENLALELQTRVISYSVSDTVGAIGYTLYEAGDVVEEFSSTEDGTEFTSKIRALTVDDIEDGRSWNFAHEFFVEQDALEPGIKPGYFLTDYYDTEPEINPGEQVKIRNPGFTCVFMEPDVEFITSTPSLERVDYIALA